MPGKGPRNIPTIALWDIAADKTPVPAPPFPQRTLTCPQNAGPLAVRFAVARRAPQCQLSGKNRRRSTVFLNITLADLKDGAEVRSHKPDYARHARVRLRFTGYPFVHNVQLAVLERANHGGARVPPAGSGGGGSGGGGASRRLGHQTQSTVFGKRTLAGLMKWRASMRAKARASARVRSLSSAGTTPLERRAVAERSAKSRPLNERPLPPPSQIFSSPPSNRRQPNGPRQSGGVESNGRQISGASSNGHVQNGTKPNSGELVVSQSNAPSTIPISRSSGEIRVLLNAAECMLGQPREIQSAEDADSTVVKSFVGLKATGLIDGAEREQRQAGSAKKKRSASTELAVSVLKQLRGVK